MKSELPLSIHKLTATLLNANSGALKLIYKYHCLLSYMSEKKFHSRQYCF